MSKIINSLKQKNIGSGYLYFYIHLITEVLCFYCLTIAVGDTAYLWMLAFIYDALAFVPQSLIGYFSDKHPKVNVGLIGIILLIIGLITFNFNLLPGTFTEIIIVCLGNAFIHVSGAEITLRSSGGNLSHSAIFVGGGSFGVILGKLAAKNVLSVWFILFLGLTMIVPELLAQEYRKSLTNEENNCSNFNYNNDKISPYLLIVLAVFVVIARGYMGYGIPTTWNKTVYQSIILYFIMGFGKCLGGILCDSIGMRKTAILSILAAIPFLIIGDKLMIVSVIGIMLFSMTMAITLGLLVSALKKKPGLAFGLTTIGLFLGTVPVFFYKIQTFIGNTILIIILSLICLIISLKIIRKDAK